MEKPYKLKREEAEFLSNEVVRQFTEVPFDNTKLITQLEKSDIYMDSERMQFAVPLDHPLTRKYLEQRQMTEDFELRRILKNYDTGHKPSLIEKGIKRAEIWWHYHNKRGFDSEVVFGLLREDPIFIEIRDKSYRKGHSFSLGGHWVKHEEITPDYTDWIRRPVVIVPGASDEEIKQLRTLSFKYQKPTLKEVEEFMGTYQNNKFR